VLRNIAGPDPKSFQPAQRHGHALQIAVADRGLVQQLGVTLVHDAELVAQLVPLFGKPYMDRAAVPTSPDSA
jgi:hypothetical protein